MAEYRWDLHYRRAQNRGAPRCESTVGGVTSANRCEYVAHGGRAHAALDGSVQWTVGAVPSTHLTVEAIHYDGGEDQDLVCEWIAEHGGAPAVGPFGGGLALDSVPRVEIPPGSWVVDVFGRLVVVSDDEVTAADDERRALQVGLSDTWGPGMIGPVTGLPS